MSVINGTAGADNLSGAAGDDVIYGGAGDDRLSEQSSGSDALYGGDGNDNIFTSRLGAAGTSLILDGGAGDDTITIQDYHAANQVFGGEGSDSISVYSSSILTLGAGADLVAIKDTSNPLVATVTDFSLGSAPDADRLDLVTLLNARGWTGNADPFASGLLKAVSVGSDLWIEAPAYNGGAATTPVVVLKGLGGQPLDPANLPGLHLSAPVAPVAATPTAIVNAPSQVQEGVVSDFDVTLTLKNVSSLSGAASIGYDALSTAQQNVDVVAPSGSTAFQIFQTPAGDYVVDLGHVKVLNDGHREGTESIVLDVTAPSGFLFANGTSSTTVSISLLDADDRIFGTAAGETISGTAGDDHVLAAEGADTIKATSGVDILNGGDGTDTLAYAGFSHDYALTLSAGAGAVSGGPERAADTLTSIEDVQFLDGVLTFDTASTAAQVVRLYDSFLGRAPDLAGFNSYLKFVQAGHSFQDMAANAAASPEFHDATAALTDTQYVTYVYEHSLHREPDPGGLQNYLDALHSGALTRTSMIVQAAESPEHVALTAGVVGAGLWIPDEKVEGLELLYDAAVQRQPDATGLSGYGAMLASGTSFRQIANQMAGSDEFQAVHGSQTDAEYVDSLYVAEVGRHADAFGLAAYTAELADGHTRGDILYETAMGQEHQSHVLAFYDPLLVGA